MVIKPFAAPGLTLNVEDKDSETIVHCTGRICAESAEAFQREICGLIPGSRGHVTSTCRIALDLASLTHIDSAGLGALLNVRAAAEKRSCLLEIVKLSPQVEQLVNLDPQVQKLVAITKPVTAITKLKDFFRRAKAA